MIKPLKLFLLGCVLLPIVMVGSCVGQEMYENAKIAHDSAMYNLPGETLTSSALLTQSLKTSMQVAEALDSYVQPRFEILRDKDFGAERITYKKHAGVIQLKVECEKEKALIANVNATKRDYVINLLHCAPKPPHNGLFPGLQPLYFNQQKLVCDDNPIESGGSDSNEVVSQIKFDWGGLEAKAIKHLPHLMDGREYRDSDASWDYLMRPVLATTQKCLGCHTKAKLGSTLGVMVYAVRKTLPPKRVTEQRNKKLG